MYICVLVHCKASGLNGKTYKCNSNCTACVINGAVFCCHTCMCLMYYVDSCVSVAMLIKGYEFIQNLLTEETVFLVCGLVELFNFVDVRTQCRWL